MLTTADLDTSGARQEKKAILEQLARVSGSTAFQGAGRLRRFLEFIVGESVSQNPEHLKEYVVGLSVFDKPESFDPRTDPIVRVQARRLRALLERYYREEADPSELVIELPKGGYAPSFRPGAGGSSRGSLAVALANHNTVVVQAFADHSHGAELGYFCRGLHQEVVSTLAQLENIRIRALHPTESRDVPVSDYGAALLIGGSVRRFADDLRVTLHIIDGAAGCYIWSESLDGDASDLFSLQRQVARLLAAKVRSEVTPAPGAPPARRPAENLAARNLYLQGRYHLNQRTEDSLRKAARFFERAMREDPQYALAHAGLTDAYSLLGHYGVLEPAEVWTKTASHAATAVMLDPNSVEAQTSLAHVKASQDWDWEGAERQFRHAITLGPSYATAHHWMAMNCLAPRARLQEALDEMLIAQALDPVSAIIARDLAQIRLYRRELNEALERCDHTIELNPHFATGFCTLAVVQEQRQDFDEATAAAQRAIQLSPTTPRAYGTLGRLYALMGNRKLSLEVLAKLQSLSASRYVSPMEFASIHFALEQFDLGFEWLTKACRDRCFELIHINVDPRFDRPRQDRRFAGIVRQLALAPARRKSSPARE